METIPNNIEVVLGSKEKLYFLLTQMSKMNSKKDFESYISTFTKKQRSDAFHLLDAMHECICIPIKIITRFGNAAGESPLDCDLYNISDFPEYTKCPDLKIMT